MELIAWESYNNSIVIAGLFGLVMYLILFLSIYKRKLTPAAGVTAFLLGSAVLTTGLMPALMLVAFFVMGVLASAYGRSIKRHVKNGQPHSEERNTLQVLCNGGIAGICVLLSFRYPEHLGLYVLLMAGSLAAAAADTVASELGTVLGKRFINVISFRKEERGLDGVISREGTLAGIAAAVVIALIYSAGAGFSLEALYIIAGGATGNYIDSVLGATLQRRGRLSNDAVNAFNTFTGAVVVLALKLIFG